MLAGADPYETFTNPLLRSAGALLVRPGFHYQAPGDAGLRAFQSTLGGRWALAVNAEVTHPLVHRERGVVRDVALEGFCDVGLVDSMATSPQSGGKRYSALHDTGIGVVTQHQVGDLAWTMRLEFPIEMNAWSLVADYRPSGGRVAFRWLVSLSPSF
jgi:hypothetical protein